MTGPDASFSDAIRDRVQKWLVEEGWKVEARDVAGAQWHFAAIDPGRRLLNIRQRTGKFDQVSILGGVRLSEDQQARFGALPEETRLAFVWDVRFDLLRMNLDFANIDLPLGAMRVTQDAYFDGGLSKDAFFNKLEDVRRGIVLIQFHIWRLLGVPKRAASTEPEPPETRPDTPIWTGGVMTVSVRYIVSDVDEAISFYTGLLDFEVEMHPAPGFAALSRGDLQLLLNLPVRAAPVRACPVTRLQYPAAGTASS